MRDFLCEANHLWLACLESARKSLRLCMPSRWVPLTDLPGPGGLFGNNYPREVSCLLRAPVS
jgi:hypothetical protein